MVHDEGTHIARLFSRAFIEKLVQRMISAELLSCAPQSFMWTGFCFRYKIDLPEQFRRLHLLRLDRIEYLYLRNVKHLGSGRCICESARLSRMGNLDICGIIKVVYKT